MFVHVELDPGGLVVLEESDACFAVLHADEAGEVGDEGQDLLEVGLGDAARRVHQEDNVSLPVTSWSRCKESQ